MIRSMTGYGRGEATVESLGRFTVEVRSVNHRFCEAMVRLPRPFIALEDRFRALILESIARGRVEVQVVWEEAGRGKKRVVVDKELALAYYNALEDLKATLGTETSPDIDLIAGFPEVFCLEAAEVDVETAWAGLQPALRDALRGLMEMREKEGRLLAADFQARLRKVAGQIEKVKGRAPAVVEEYRQRLATRLRELLPQNPLDEGRLAMEVALMAERCDISEEILRLESHLEQLEACLEQDEPTGRKIEFLLQELNREINTIGSKASDLVISSLVVDIKGELEKLREQAQNIE